MPRGFAEGCSFSVRIQTSQSICKMVLALVILVGVQCRLCCPFHHDLGRFAAFGKKYLGAAVSCHWWLLTWEGVSNLMEGKVF